MKRYIRTTKSFLSLFLPFLSMLIMQNMNAQDLNKEIYVESNYRPEIADAEKISSMPDIEDSISMETDIDYTLLPSRIKTDFSPRPIKPAKMVGTPLDRLYNSYFRLGFGNYTTPLVEYSIHNLRSKEYSIGAYAFHKSSHTKYKYDNGDEVPAGYGHNELTLHGKKFYNNLNLYANIGAKNHRIRYYGYNTDNFIDINEVPDLEREDVRQNYALLFGEAGLKSTDGDSTAVDYTLKVRGEYFQDYFENKEPHVQLKGIVSSPLKSFRLGVEADFDHFSFQDSISESVATFKPFLLKRTSEWEVKVAGKLTIENEVEQKIRIYPDLSLRFQIINKVLVSYFGLTGYYQNNSYQSTASENPFIVPGLRIENSNHNFVAYGGVEGHFNRKSTYRIDVTFDAGENIPFYLNDNTLLENQFRIVYDDASLIKYHGEVGWQALSYLSFFTSINYHDYKLTALEKPWHRPNLEYSFATRYNFKEKVYVDFEYIALGKRYAKTIDPDDSDLIELDPIHDINILLEYKYSNVFSVFLHFYNLLSQEYYIWNNYPSQKINVLAGISYKF